MAVGAVFGDPERRPPDQRQVVGKRGVGDRVEVGRERPHLRQLAPRDFTPAAAAAGEGDRSRCDERYCRQAGERGRGDLPTGFARHGTNT